MLELLPEAGSLAGGGGDDGGGSGGAGGIAKAEAMECGHVIAAALRDAEGRLEWAGLDLDAGGGGGDGGSGGFVTQAVWESSRGIEI